MLALSDLTAGCRLPSSELLIWADRKRVLARMRIFDKLLDRYEEDLDRPQRTPLRTGQHILHLVLTVLTGGLWAPVWVVRAWRGNPAPPRAARPSPP
jgi:hypothetical protein